jgi:quinol monooxygenase YgiN
MSFDDDVLEEALAVLLDQWRDQPMTSEDIRRETVQFVVEQCPDISRGEVEALYDGLYPTGTRRWA